MSDTPPKRLDIQWLREAVHRAPRAVEMVTAIVDALQKDGLEIERAREAATRIGISTLLRGDLDLRDMIEHAGTISKLYLGHLQGLEDSGMPIVDAELTALELTVTELRPREGWQPPF